MKNLVQKLRSVDLNNAIEVAKGIEEIRLYLKRATEKSIVDYTHNHMPNELDGQLVEGGLPLSSVIINTVIVTLDEMISHEFGKIKDQSWFIVDHNIIFEIEDELFVKSIKHIRKLFRDELRNRTSF